MGFGLLLVGYFTASIMALNSFGGVFRTVGYLLICKGTKKLSEYNKSFFFLLVYSVLALAFSMLCAFSDVTVFLNKNLIISGTVLSQGITDALPYLKIIFDFIFVGLMCFAVRSIAKETGAQKPLYASVRNFVFYCMFAVIQFLVWLASYTKAESLVKFVSSTMLPAWMVILNIVCILLNCMMLFSCYAKICDENDLDMPQKPSRFAFINRMRAEKEAKRQKYIAEAEQQIKGPMSNYTSQQQARAEASDRARKKNKHK